MCNKGDATFSINDTQHKGLIWDTQNNSTSAILEFLLKKEFYLLDFVCDGYP
jgi:hypothetical protein